MKILVCGANGFIGKTLCARLLQSGFQVLRGVRHAVKDDEVPIDYSKDFSPDKWLPKLSGVDLIINAVGILTEGKNRRFDAIHHRAPVALFEAACRAKVKSIIQISALGADTGHTRYFESKYAADAYLQTLPVAYAIVRPALVYGDDGDSAHFFRMLASMPLHFVPAGGHQLLRPIHVNDLADIVVRLATSFNTNAHNKAGKVIEAVGATQVEYRDMLAIYRKSMGLPPAFQISIPKTALDIGATLLNRLPGSMLTRDTWQMFQAGNTADVSESALVLGRMPTGVEGFIAKPDQAFMRGNALASWQRVLLRGVLAAIWLFSALLSLFIFPVHESLALLSRVHLYGSPALAALYLASMLDAAFGLATLFKPGRRLWLAQILLISVYSAIIAIALPEFLRHPFAPVLKNLPILALLAILLAEEKSP